MHACYALQGGPQVPVGALMRIVSHAPLQSADRAGGKGGSGGSRRRLAPTPVAQVTRDERFDRQPAAPKQQPHARRKLSPSPVTPPPGGSAASSSAITSDARAEQRSQTTACDRAAYQSDGSAVSHRGSWASVTAAPSPLGNSSSLANGSSSIRGGDPRDGGCRKGTDVTPGSNQHRVDALSLRFGDLDMSAQSGFPQHTPSSRQQGSRGHAVSWALSTPTSNGGSMAGSQELRWHEIVTLSASLQSQAGSNAPPTNTSCLVLPSTPGSAESVSSRPPSADMSGQQHHAACSAQQEPAGAQQGAAADETLPLDTAEPHKRPALQESIVSGREAEAGAPTSLMRMSEQCRRAAALHAAVLTGPDLAPLGQQLEMLLQLLALPPTVHVGARTSCAEAAEQQLFPSSCTALAYACSVLQRLGSSSGP